jgi:hypothetical protein
VLFKQPLEDQKRAIPDSETSSSSKKVRDVRPWALTANTASKMMLDSVPDLSRVAFGGPWKDRRPEGVMKVIAPIVAPLLAPSTCPTNGPTERMRNSVFNYDWMDPAEIKACIMSSTMPGTKNPVFSESQAIILDHFLGTQSSRL